MFVEFRYEEWRVVEQTKLLFKYLSLKFYLFIEKRVKEPSVILLYYLTAVGFKDLFRHDVKFT